MCMCITKGNIDMYVYVLVDNTAGEPQSILKRKRRKEEVRSSTARFFE